MLNQSLGVGHQKSSQQIKCCLRSPSPLAARKCDPFPDFGSLSWKPEAVPLEKTAQKISSSYRDRTGEVRTLSDSWPSMAVGHSLEQTSKAIRRMILALSIFHPKPPPSLSTRGPGISTSPTSGSSPPPHDWPIPMPSSLLSVHSALCIFSDEIEVDTKL